MQMQIKSTDLPASRQAHDAGERESIISWSDADKGIATIYTSQRPMRTRLRKNPLAMCVEVFRDDRGRVTGEQFSVPSKAITIRSKLGTRKPSPRSLDALKRRTGSRDSRDFAHFGAGPGAA